MGVEYFLRSRQGNGQSLAEIFNEEKVEAI